MPADETYDVVHELTRKADHLESCHSSKRGRGEKASGYWCQDGWKHSDFDKDGMPRVSMPHWVFVHSSETVNQCRANVGVAKIKTCEGCDECR